MSLERILDDFVASLVPTASPLFRPAYREAVSQFVPLQLGTDKGEANEIGRVPTDNFHTWYLSAPPPVPIASTPKTPSSKKSKKIKKSKAQAQSLFGWWQSPRGEATCYCWWTSSETCIDFASFPSAFQDLGRALTPKKCFLGSYQEGAQVGRPHHT